MRSALPASRRATSERIPAEAAVPAGAPAGHEPGDGATRPLGRLARHRRRLPEAASAGIVLALVALVAVPLLGDRYTRRFHYEMREVAEPARGYVTEIQLALALEGSALHDYVEGGDPQFLERYRDALARERAAHERLAPLSRRLGPQSAERFHALHALAVAWHAGVERFLGDSARAGDRDDPLQEDLYEGALVEAARLDEAITAASDARRARIVAAERLERRLTLLLGLVAALAVLSVTWLGRRLQASADTLRRRGRELEQVMESKARLMRGLSHDLKNPLNAIDGYAQLLHDGVLGPVTEPQRQGTARIRGAVRALSGLVGDLLELARVEAGHLDVDPRATDAGALVREVGEEYRAASEAAGHTLEVELAPELPLVDTDARRVRQVLGNLVSNAVKYTPPPGRIGLRAEVRQAQGGPRQGSWLAIAVSDSGNGIPRDRLGAIFDEFARLAPDAAPGSGLGLAIARRVARLLGGDITVASEVGRGATFTLWLPTGRREERPGRPSAGTDAAS